MKRSRAPSVLSSQTTTTIVKKAKPQKSVQNFRAPRWAGKQKAGFPRELRMKHVYVTIGTLLSTAGSQPTAIYSCNGMYDPDISGAGHQPMYFDQLTAIYNHYTVLSSKITIRARARASGVAAGLGVYINDDATVTPTDFTGRAEHTDSVYKTVGTSGSEETVIVKRWSAAKNFGPNPLSDPNLQGTAAANPTEIQNFTMFLTPLDGATSCTIDYLVTIEYDACWQELKDIAPS